MRGIVCTLNEIAARFEGLASFVFVYIAEAHACDEWPISQLDEEIPRHRTLSDRRAAAAGFLHAFPLHSAFEVVLDTMDDDFDRVFASWPFRFWVIMQGKVSLKPQPEQASYDINELGRWLERHAAALSSPQ